MPTLHNASLTLQSSVPILLSFAADVAEQRVVTAQNDADAAKVKQQLFGAGITKC